MNYCQTAKPHSLLSIKPEPYLEDVEWAHKFPQGFVPLVWLLFSVTLLLLCMSPFVLQRGFLGYVLGHTQCSQ